MNLKISADVGSAAAAMDDQSPRLYVGNLPYAAQPSEVQALFDTSNIPIQNIVMSIDPFTGRNPSYCFVDFHNLADATQALQTLQGRLLRGRPIKLNLATRKKYHGKSGDPENRPRLPAKTYDRGWRAQPLSIREPEQDCYAFDRWAREDAADHWIAPVEESRRVWVGGLPQIPNQDTLNMEMRQLFAGYNLQAVSKMISPRNQKMQAQPGSHYYCFVDLASADEAKRAVGKLNGVSTPYGGRYKVRISIGKGGSGKVRREQLGEA